ncbi:MAG: hypothetical protein GF307_13775 [candidate division Zixibacteria bacterium]|nr:hypothetical protein [candidate division Zixibacteria bacterium]
MKKFVLLTLAATLLMFASANAQEGPVYKGTWIVDGNASFYSASGDLYKPGDDGQTWINFSPEVAYFVMNGLAVGLTLDFSSWSQGDAKSNELGIGPMVSFYYDMDKTKDEAKGKLFPFASGAFEYMSTTTNSGAPNADDYKYTMTRIKFKGGILYMLSNAVGINANLRIDLDSKKQTDPVESDSVSGTRFGAEVGITAFLW